MIVTKSALDKILLQLLGEPNLVEQWWLFPNRAFSYAAPSEVDLPTVHKYLVQFLSGNIS